MNEQTDVLNITRDCPNCPLLGKNASGALYGELEDGLCDKHKNIIKCTCGADNE